ncbi:MAG: hypothetical protein K2X87_19145, partial [Gemmataceae bacterium]|nr:hypothetical protein [Gemmataceae bacterium]
LAVPPQVVAQPVFTALEAGAAAGANPVTVPAVNAGGGQPWGLSAGTPVPWAGAAVVVGVGAAAEVRTVAAATPISPGAGGGTVSTLTLSAPLTYAHAAGESVANGLPAHPGFQAVDVVNTTSSTYRAVVPFVQRVTR